MHCSDTHAQLSTSDENVNHISLAGEESLGHSHNIHGGILWDAELQQGINGRLRNIRSKLFQVVACRAGRMAAERVSGAAVFVMMAESFVPRGVFLES